MSDVRTGEEPSLSPDSSPRPGPAPEAGSIREWCRAVVERPAFGRWIIAVILLNAAVIGFETSTSWMAEHGEVTRALGTATVVVFVVELALRLTAYGRGFFTDGWNVFDFFVVAIALVPGSASSEVLRVLRILRVLRLLSTVRSMRMVAGALVATVPGMLSIAALLGMLLYISAVVGTQLFGDIDPEQYGDLGTSLLTMFQITTGDDWGNVVAPVTEAQPWSWLFFLSYMILASFIVLNLFIAVAVEALDRQKEAEEPPATADDTERVLAAIADLRGRIDDLERRLPGAEGDPPPRA